MITNNCGAIMALSRSPEVLLEYLLTAANNPLMLFIASTFAHTVVTSHIYRKMSDLALDDEIWLETGDSRLLKMVFAD
jgi:hypothetical protein